jgi:hypothetical protein
MSIASTQDVSQTAGHKLNVALGNSRQIFAPGKLEHFICIVL